MHNSRVWWAVVYRHASESKPLARHDIARVLSVVVRDREEFPRTCQSLTQIARRDDNAAAAKPEER
jgi:hypothetical protein